MRESAEANEESETREDAEGDLDTDSEGGLDSEGLFERSVLKEEVTEGLFESGVLEEEEVVVVEESLSKEKGTPALTLSTQSHPTSGPNNNRLAATSPRPS